MMNVPPDRSWTTVFFMQPFCSTNSGSITGESCKSCVFVLARVFWDECSHTLRHTPGPDMLHYCVTIWEMVQGRAAAGRQWRGECVCVCVIDGRVCECLMKQDPAEQRWGKREGVQSKGTRLALLQTQSYLLCLHLCPFSSTSWFAVFVLLTFFSSWLILVVHLLVFRLY